ncbi:MAG: T9SS type A sorting domain-containing protein [Saprospiraceae bacterium]
MKNSLLICLIVLVASGLSAQCGNDQTPPVLVPAFNSVATLSGPKCTVVIKPEQLLQSVSDNCSPTAALTLRVRRAGTGSGFPLLPSGAQLTFTPTDGPGPHFVEVWARDTMGNAGFIFTSFTIENPGGCSFNLLPDTLRANVGVASGLEDMQWIVDGTLSPDPGAYLISDSYIALFSDIFSGFGPSDHITITPAKDVDPLNGVSTFDLVLTTQAILGWKPFNNPYKYIAADADRNGRVTVGDLLDFRKLILGIYTELPDNPAWRFVPEDYIFPKPDQPFFEPIPESVTFGPGRSTPLPNFIPIKVGDVNSTAILNSFSDPVVDDRSLAKLEIPDMLLKPGQTLRVPVYLADFPNLVGLQCAFRVDPARAAISGVLPGALPGFSDANFFQPEPGLLTLSWSSLELEQADTREPLFFLEINALQAGSLREFLNLNSGRLQAEAYDLEDHIAKLELQYRSLPAPGLTTIQDAYPNPATGQFFVPVQLAEPGVVAVALFGPDGRRVSFWEQSFAAGIHQLEVPCAGLASGLYSYRVFAGTAVAQGKVVLR